MTSSALVLSGGGALWIAHLGALSELYARWYTFDWYAGVSAWAIVTAGLALGYNPDEFTKLVYDTKLLSLAFDFSWNPGGLFSGKKVREQLDTIFGNKKFTDLKSPLIIWATNYETGEFLRIDKGLIADAVEASISVPILFPPFFHPEYHCQCVDGALSHNFPLHLASTEYTGTKIIGIDVSTYLSPLSDFEGHTQGLTLAKNLQRVLNIFFRHQPIPKDPRIKIIRPYLSDFTSFDIFRLEEMHQIGRESVIYLEKQL